MAKRKTRGRKRSAKRTGKTIHLGNGFRLNISKSGVNLTGGISGARMSVGTSGIKSTLSVPGTGISKTKTLVSKKDIIDKVKSEDKEKKSKKSESNKAKDSKAKDSRIEEVKEEKLNKEELESLKKREAAKKRVDAIESQFKTGDHKNSIEEKVLDKDVPKSFIKEGFKTGWWIALIVLGALGLIFNLFLGVGIMLLGGALVFLEFQLPKNRAKRYFNNGIDLYKEKKYKESMKEMEKAILFDPKHEYILLTMGTIKFEVFDDSQGAIVHLIKAMELYNNEDAIFLLGKCYFSLEEYAKTIELLQVISLRKSKERDRVLLVARSYLITSKPKLAIEMLLPLANEYVINKDELIEVNYWLGYSYLDDFDFKQAKVYLDLVHKQDPEYKDIVRLIENLDV